MPGSLSKRFLFGTIACFGVLARACTDDAPQEMRAVPDGDAADTSSDGRITSEAGPDADAGTQDQIVPDSDGSPDAAPDTADSDSGVVPSGPRLLQAGSKITIWGITSDDYVVYYDDAAKSYFTKSLGDAEPKLLYAVPPSGSAYINVLGRVVSLQTWSTASNKSQLAIWSSDAPEPAPIWSAALLAYAQTVWASEDSKAVVYVRVSENDWTAGAFYGSSADGTQQRLLASNVALNLQTCPPTASFTGSGRVVLSYCTTPSSDIEDAGADAASDDGGTNAPKPHRMLASFSFGSDWTPGFSLRDVTGAFAADPHGQYAVVPTLANQGRMQVFPMNGDPAGRVLDSETPLLSGQFIKAGQSSPWYVVYNTDTGALKRSYASLPGVQMLAESGVNSYLAMSRDGNWLIVSGTHVGGGAFTDISAVSTVTPGDLRPIATSSEYDGLSFTVSNAPGAAFSTDQKYVLFFSHVRFVNGDYRYPSMGYVHAGPLASPHEARQISNGYAPLLFNLPSSKLLLADNYETNEGGGGGTVDLDLVDPSGTDAAQRIVSGAALSINVIGAALGVTMSSDRSQVVYYASQPSPGIYAVRVP